MHGELVVVLRGTLPDRGLRWIELRAAIAQFDHHRAAGVIEVHAKRLPRVTSQCVIDDVAAAFLERDMARLRALSFPEWLVKWFVRHRWGRAA